MKNELLNSILNLLKIITNQMEYRFRIKTKHLLNQQRQSQQIKKTLFLLHNKHKNIKEFDLMILMKMGKHGKIQKLSSCNKPLTNQKNETKNWLRKIQSLKECWTKRNFIKLIKKMKFWDRKTSQCILCWKRIKI